MKDPFVATEWVIEVGGCIVCCDRVHGVIADDMDCVEL